MKSRSPRRSPLWREPDFLRLWAAQGVSEFGARITREGLPIMAVTLLAAQPHQLGLLSASTNAASLAVGLACGDFVDHTRRRNLLVGADLLRAAILVTVPLAAWAGVLTLPQVYAVAACVAAASVLFAIADHAYLPSLVGPGLVLDANSKISATESVAEMGGPALAGVLFQWLTAPFAVAVNAATYLASALFLMRIRSPEPEPDLKARRGWWSGVKIGAATAWAEPHVRVLLAWGVAGGVFGGLVAPLYILYALRDLQLTPALMGLAIGAGGVGALAGSVLAQPMAQRLGVGPAICVSGVLAGLGALIIPLTPPGTVPAMTGLVASQLLGDSFGVVSVVLAASLRQTLIPMKLLGRVGASFRAVAGAAAVLGALAGGALGAALGVRETLFIAAAGLIAVPALALLTPLRTIRTLPGLPADGVEP